MKKAFVCLGLCVLAASAQKTQPKDDATAFANRLLASMTLDEKIEQMEQAAGQNYTPQQADELARKGVGSFLFLTDPVRINELQKIAVTQTPHKIPLIFGYDVIHGFRTINPVPIAMAASWDASLAEHAQSMAAREARAAGVEWAFSPMVDIARDPRWGRIMEGAGEDPYLGEQMAAAQVRGFQGPVVGAPDHILASVKHFAAYGAPYGGRDYDSVDLSEDALRNVYLRPYAAAAKAGAATFMSAYTDVDSVPATGNRWLQHDILRGEWGFKGFTVSDWDAVKNLQTHGYAANPAEAAQRAVEADVNMEMTSDVYRKELPALVKSGKVTVAQIDALVRPILEMKYRLGLFTNPYVDLDKFKRETLSAEQRESARKAAEQVAVLLKNDGHLLPLAKSAKTIALIGPLADSKVDTLGSWSLHAQYADTVTIAEGMRQKFPQAKLLVDKGVEIVRPTSSIFDGQAAEPKPTLLTDADKKAAFEKAIDDVKQADIAVLVLGEAMNMSGEQASRATLTLPGKQQELLEAAVATGKPVVLVIMAARPLEIGWAVDHVPAILDIWYPGTEGGHAVANLLAGDANPGGKLPVTWPRAVGQVPIFYAHYLTQDPSQIGNRYWDMPSTPQYPFGYGLSYTNFTVDGLKLGSETLAHNGTLKVSVQVHNTGSVAGAEVVQVYTHQRAGSASRPVRELRAFSKVTLAAGESREVTLDVPAAELTFWSPSLRRWVLEPGTFDLWAGDSSDASLHTTFTLQ
ncbi:beta-glucosidase BglX [Granulicella cerasi]|uniref:Beta-glucosidase BglX n=1 Tax=Granulicella cerasi TaxID=741063 RepID=A0ABW1ZD97_9BACT|nr:beta-glucosidase BglX [Granulicella cerasi]